MKSTVDLGCEEMEVAATSWLKSSRFSRNISLMDGKKHVVVLGGGFGGLEFCKSFHSEDARITLVDRTNHYLFQPLLYQVATAGLGATDIAQPIRSILSDRPDITVLMDEVLDFNLTERKVFLGENTLHYDFLVLAMGGRNSYFGHPEWEAFAPGLKSLDDALRIRSRVLLTFEKAENDLEGAEREQLMTIVIIGGGPTGVELAGAFSELARTVLRRDFRHIDPAKARIILLEGAPVILGQFPPELSLSAQRQLEALGVHVRTSTKVKDIRNGEVELENGEIIRAATILWAAGVSAVAMTKKLGVELDRAGRVKVNADLSLPGHPEVFAIGDMALVMGDDGKPVPGVSPAAMQMGRHAAEIIAGQIRYGPKTPRPPFKYTDKGTMATIGRSAAVAWLKGLRLSGYPAWLFWLFVHIVFLIGFRNRLAVLLNWVYAYIGYKRGARIITTGIPEPPETK
ncbi:MAG TPA: NAD(P)/FAD-dependent oxidoreductase [Candidatus Acidoferrales bacterium]|nr:NAD(P)/FAD-dependent oxidoreductase [Candidatus Acidoferrales bacterium]